MKRCIIITARMLCPIAQCISLKVDDLILCADSGYQTALEQNVRIDAVMGDFDSFPKAQVCAPLVLQSPAEKDDTDTLLCLRYGLSRGCDTFVILGGLSGRLDHTFANLQLLAFGLAHGASVYITDGKNTAFLLHETSITLLPCDYKLSVFAWTPTCTGVTLCGVKYPLQNATLTNTFPVGVSNEFTEQEAQICCKTGTLLVMLCQE